MDAQPPQPTPIPPASSPAPSAPTGPSLGSAVRTTSLVTLASRIGGLARDMLVGLMFRDTALGSAFSFAFAVPNLFRRLFGEGALSAAFIPLYTRAHKNDPALAGALASLTLRWLGLATSALTVVAEVVLLILWAALPPDADRQTMILLTMVMLPFMPTICMAAIMSGMLQVHGRFGPASSGPLILNTFIIVVGLYFVLTKQAAGHAAAYSIAAATTLSGATQACWFYRLLTPHVRWTRATAPAAPQGREMVGKFIPVLIGAGTLQLNTFLDQLIATYTLWAGPKLFGADYPLSDASGTIIAMAGRLYQFPLGVFGIAVAAAVFPLLSRHADEPARFIDILRRGLRLSFFISLPAALGLILVRTDATAALVPTFSEEGKLRCAAVLMGFAPGVWAYSVNHVLTRAFYALGDTATPMRIAIAMVLVNVTLNLTLIWPMQEAGLAWSTSISAMLQTLVLLIILKRRLGADLVGPIIDGPTARSLLRTLILAGIMALAVYGVQLLWPTPDDARWSHHVARFLVTSAVGGAVFLIIARALRITELLQLLPRRLGGTRGEI